MSKPDFLATHAGIQLPIVEDRMARLEAAIKAFVDYRGEIAIKNSILPGMDVDDDEESDSSQGAQETNENEGSSTEA